jgi:hypothetical protein
VPDDLYTIWLRVPAGSRPPDHYALLGLPRFSVDSKKIDHAANVQLDRLDRRALHPDPQLRDACQRLMNEVARARTVLVSPVQREAYDAALKQKGNLSQGQAEANRPGTSFVDEERFFPISETPVLEDAANAAAQIAGPAFPTSRSYEWPHRRLALVTATLGLLCVAGFWMLFHRRAPTTSSAVSSATEKQRQLKALPDLAPVVVNPATSPTDLTKAAAAGSGDQASPVSQEVSNVSICSIITRDARRWVTVPLTDGSLRGEFPQVEFPYVIWRARDGTHIENLQWGLSEVLSGQVPMPPRLCNRKILTSVTGSRLALYDLEHQHLALQRYVGSTRLVHRR